MAEIEDLCTLMPSDAIQCGIHKDNTPIYIGRAYLNGDIIPAKIVPSEEVAYVSWGGFECPRHDFEVKQ